MTHPKILNASSAFRAGYKTFRNTLCYVNSDPSEQAVVNYAAKYGSFDGTTNAPVSYPVPQSGIVSMCVRVLLSNANLNNNETRFEWQPSSQAGTVYALQTSTNLFGWNTLFTVTNNGTVCTYENMTANSAARFYRLIPQ